MTGGATHTTDIAVIGAGAAGLAATLMLRRHRRDVVLFDGGPPRNHAAREVHGYLGLPGVSGEELKRLGLEQVRDVGGRIEGSRVVGVTRTDRRLFAVETERGEQWTAAALLLATGVRDRYPRIDRFEDFFGHSVHVCPHCDAYEWRDAPIAVISWNADTRPYALKFTDWTRDVTLVTDGHQPALDDAERADLAAHGIRVCTGTVERFEGDDGRLTGLRMTDGSLLPAAAAFFDLGQEIDSTLARSLGVPLDEASCIAADDHGRTGVRGVWAAGDITGRDQFVALAAAQGVVAAVDIHRALSDVDEQPED